MRFAWNRAMAEPAPADGPTPGLQTTDEPALAAVELRLRHGRYAGWIATSGQRASDWLNARAEAAVHSLQPLADGDDAAGSPPPAASETMLPRDEVVWVVPPPLPPNRHLRLHRRRMLVHLELDDHEVSGQVHVRPGADAVDQVLRGPRDFVPLTEVHVAPRDDPGHGISLPVLIVNRMHVRRVVEDAAHVSGPVPAPVVAAPDAEPDPRIALLVPDASAVATPASAAEAAPEPAADGGGSEPSGVAILHSALTLLLDAGVVDVVEFQSIRARIPPVTPH